MEKLGKPGAPFCIDSLLPQRKRLAEVNGMPTLRIITIPSLSYMSAEGYPEKMKPVAASVFDATIKALTTPLSKAEMNPAPPAFDYGPLQFSGHNYTEAVEKFQQYCVDNYLSDGLPVIPPTREAVDWMLQLAFPAFGDPKYLAILVAGDAASNTVLWNSPVGSTSVNLDLAESIKGSPPAFMTKVVRGASRDRTSKVIGSDRIPDANREGRSHTSTLTTEPKRTGQTAHLPVCPWADLW